MDSRSSLVHRFVNRSFWPFPPGVGPSHTSSEHELAVGAFVSNYANSIKAQFPA